jgi:hypothetical protein
MEESDDEPEGPAESNPSFLRAFAPAKGSDQLYQRSLFLTKLQMSQMLHFHVLSIYVYHTFRYYGEQLKKMIRKGELRNALLDFLVSQRWVSYCMSLSASSPYLMDML